MQWAAFQGSETASRDMANPLRVQGQPDSVLQCPFLKCKVEAVASCICNEISYYHRRLVELLPRNRRLNLFVITFVKIALLVLSPVGWV